MNYLQLAQNWFNDLPLQRKLTLSVSLLLLAFLTVLAGWWLLSPSYAVLFNHLDEQDSSRIISQLEQEKIDYQLRNGSSDILIDKQLIAKTRLKIMGSGLQLAGSVGFELFDKSDFGMTDFSQKINYQRALQGELERTIASFDEVRQARVHLVIPESHLFDKEDNQPKAAVTVYLKRQLMPQQVQSIQQLITASVAHLNSKNVIIVDQNGNTLSASEEDNTSNHFTAKKTIEHYLNDKVSQMLYKIFAKNQVMVKIDVAMNYDELQRELIKPQTQGLITHEKEIKHTSTGKTDKEKNNEDITREKSYQFGSEKELFKRASGTIDRLTISVILPQNTDDKTRIQVQELVKSAVGFSAQRGDIISVANLISPPKAPVYAVQEAPLTPAAWPIDKNNILLGVIVLLVFGSSTLVVMRRIRLKRRQQLLLELTQWLTHHE